MGEGNVFRLFTREEERSYPKVPIPPAKVPNPLARWRRGRGYPKVPTPQPGQDRGSNPKYLPLARSGRGEVPQGTYTPPPSQVRMGEGIAQGTYPLPRPGQDGGGGSPRYLHPGIGRYMEYLIHCGRYASCAHAGGLSCLSLCLAKIIRHGFLTIIRQFYPSSSIIREEALLDFLIFAARDYFTLSLVFDFLGRQVWIFPQRTYHMKIRSQSISLPHFLSSSKLAANLVTP